MIGEGNEQAIFEGEVGKTGENRGNIIKVVVH